MADFDALFFDMDGTLVESKSLARAAFYEGFGKAGYEIRLDPWPYSGRTDNDIIRLVRRSVRRWRQKKAQKKKKIIIEPVRLEIIVCLC